VGPNKNSIEETGNRVGIGKLSSPEESLKLVLEFNMYIKRHAKYPLDHPPSVWRRRE